MSEAVPVLYIGSSGRSGSTILAQMLGQVPDFVNVGELWLIWERGLRENELCGCGEPFRSCGFWAAVGEEAFGGWNKIDLDRMLAVTPYLRRFRYVPHFVLAQRSRIHNWRVNKALKEWGPVLRKLYPAIQKVSGARVVVDSSKRFSYALLLEKLPFIDLRLLHLLRDSRAVAYSWSRRKTRPEGKGQRAQMPQLSPAWTALTWNLWQYIYRSYPTSGRLSYLRYEDLVYDPASRMEGVLADLCLESEEVDDFHFLSGREVSLAVDHTVSGNPSRFRTGSVELRPDEEWKANMKRADKYLVTALTAHLLLKYGYLREQ